MEYIIFEKHGRKKEYVEDFYEGNSIHMTPNKEEAKVFGWTEANRIANRHDMYLEEAY